jgi:2-oxoglutarate dehydrogenase E2 component (dihydrolipoamide succinyltransferase)
MEIIDVVVPGLGESITEVQIGVWLKREGEAVEVDEALVEIESEKATLDLPSPAAGVLREVLRATGERVRVGEVIGRLEW